MTLPPPDAARAAGRRCRHRSVDPGSPRPRDLLAAFFAVGLVHLLAGAVAGVAGAVSGDRELHWLALHLLLLGGISQFVLGAGQFFVCAFLATDPPPRRLIAAQLASWNAGTVMVAVGDPAGMPALVEAGGGLIAVGLVMFALGLRRMERRSVQHAPWALRWYQASAACLGLGGVIGVLMARGTAWSPGDLLGVHLALTLAGWLGTAIIGTLHTFFPSLTQTQLRYPRLQRPAYVLWLLGVIELAVGAAFTSRAVLAAGWTDLLAASALLCLSLLTSLRSAPRPLSLPARLVALAQACLVTGLTVALIATLRMGVYGPFSGSGREVLAVLLLAGWIGLTVTGSLLHLLAILARIRRFTVSMPALRPARDGLVAFAAAAVIIVLALSRITALGSLRIPATVLTLLVGAWLVGRVGSLAVRALAPRR